MESFMQISSKFVSFFFIGLYRPSNVLLNEYSNLKLCDFGLAKKIVDLLQTDNESNKVCD